MARRCGGVDDDDEHNTAATAGVQIASQTQTLLEVAQTIALLSTLSDRKGESNMVTLSTLHAAKGLEWPHVLLVGVSEGMLPFRQDEAKTKPEEIVTRLEEERRLMYVGITRARNTLVVSWPRRKKKGRDTVAGEPSRFIKEMALDQATVREDPREKLRALRAEFAAKALQSAASAAAANAN